MSAERNAPTHYCEKFDVDHGRGCGCGCPSCDAYVVAAVDAAVDTYVEELRRG